MKAPARVAEPAAAHAVSVRPELDLFVEQVAWLGRHLTDRSRLAVMSWIGRALSNDSRGPVQDVFRIEHAIQVQVEMSVLSLLRRPWDKRTPRYTRLDMPERNVDWARTYLEEQTATPTRFWAREEVSLFGGDVLAALAAVGRNIIDFAAFGELDPQRRSRLEALEDAINSAERVIGRRRAAYNTVIEHRLMRMDEEARRAARTIRSWLSFWYDRFGDDNDVTRLRELGALLEQSDLVHGRRTLDSLLELCAALSIARAAEETMDEMDLPAGCRWRVETVDDRGAKNVPRIVLRAGALECTISKNTPPSDAMVPLLHQMGLAARGHQPDIVLTFSMKGADGRERQVIALADAKRNAGGDGRGYLSSSVEAAIVYAVSFGHLMGLRFQFGAQPGIDGAVLPAVTLFCRQGVQRVAGAGPDVKSIHSRLRSPEKLPAVMALELGHFFDGQMGPGWCSTILSAWFGRIAKQALSALRALA